MIWFTSYIYAHARYFFPSYVFTRIIISLIWNYVKSERITKYFQKTQDFNPRINPCSKIYYYIGWNSKLTLSNIYAYM